MSKQNQRPADGSRSHRSDSSDREAKPTAALEAWSTTKCRLVSLAILAYLFILLVGPLSNPVASPYLSGPIAEKVSPIHRALFLGHGYRFFGPDPGPGHLLVYQGQRADGSPIEGVFPDSDQHWPRLLYHRWFMLSETVFSENALLLSEAEFDTRAEEYEREITDYQEAGKLKFATELIKERDLEAHQYQQSRRRVELLGSAIANGLANQHDAESIKLFLQIRQIPLAEEVASGVNLDDPELLSELLPIGELDKSGYRIISPYATDSQENAAPEFLPNLEVLQ